jgi:predicted alpha/beta-fold hydrolase
MLRYLGEVGTETPLVSSIAMCAGYCGKTGFHVLRNNKLYSRVLAKKWIDVLKQNAHVYEGTGVDLELVSKARSLEELDRFFSLQLLEYDDVEFVTDQKIIARRSNLKLTVVLCCCFLQRILQRTLKPSSP